MEVDVTRHGQELELAGAARGGAGGMHEVGMVGAEFRLALGQEEDGLEEFADLDELEDLSDLGELGVGEGASGGAAEVECAVLEEREMASMVRVESGEREMEEHPSSRSSGSSGGSELSSGGGAGLLAVSARRSAASAGGEGSSESPSTTAIVTVRGAGVEKPKRKPKRKRSEARKLSNNRHTKKCRDKLNARYVKLLQVLPPPAEGSPRVKHKAQILCYAIRRFREIQLRNMELEMQLALASRRHLTEWVRGVVSRASSLPEALGSFMQLICLQKHWKYAELWVPRRSSSATPKLEYMSSSLRPGVDAERVARLENYRRGSRRFLFPPKVGVPGRVFLTRRPEWLRSLSDPVAFPRAPVATQYDVRVTFAVPVLVQGKVAVVVEFYDTDPREYDPDVMILANDVAMLIGKAYDRMQ